MVGALIDLVFWLMVLGIVVLLGSPIGEVVVLVVLVHWLLGGRGT
jgi:hypothetical protein